MTHVSAPGKLFLSGEWAVLEIGNAGIVTAVDKRVHAKLEESDSIEIQLDDFNITVDAVFENGKMMFPDANDGQLEKLIFIKGAIEAALNYLGEYKLFKIRSWGEMSSLMIDGEQRKIGFGSSAAAVVAAVAGILEMNGKDITSRETKDIIYKLSAIAHYFAQGKLGSAFDIAASTYGGVFVYKRFDPKWLEEQINTKSVKEVVEMDWPEFMVEELTIPENFNLVIGWTKQSASTSDMVKQMKAFQADNPDKYNHLMKSVADIAAIVIDAWKSSNTDTIISSLKENENRLAVLGKTSGVNIETDDLKKLSEIANQQGGAGKLSGAGGGDCGIAVCYSSEISDKIKKEWENAGFYLVDADLDKQGVRKE